MPDSFWMLVFWAAAGLLFLAYPGYPLLLRGISGRRAAPFADSADPPACSVAVVLVVRNEAARMDARLRNLLDSTVETREIIVVCDGCSDSTAAVAKAAGHPAIQVIEVPEPRGKPAGLNIGVQAATADVVVLCDARQRFESSTIPRLLRWFADPDTGAVSGALEIESSQSSSGRGVDAYWRLEKLIRQMESDLDSAVGCTGAVYALRRACFQPLPEDTLLDDVVEPMLITAQGKRVRFDATALAYDPQTLDGALEQRRKVRTLAGNFQMLARYPAWMLPGGHRLWWQLVLHKYLRLAGPFLLMLTLAASLALLDRPFFQVAAAAHGPAALLAGIGLARPGWKAKCFSWPAGFVFLQWCVMKGLASWLRGTHNRGWR